MAEQSSVSKDLWLINGIEDFRFYSRELLHLSRRHVSLLTYDLNELIYGTSEFAEAISAFSRSSRHTQVQILIKDTKHAIETGHPLVRLAQRLSSKIILRKMTVEPTNKDMAFIVGDADKLFYQNDHRVYRGFFNSNAAREVKPLKEEFNYLWQYAEPEPEFQLLHI